MSSGASSAVELSDHRRTLGGCWIVYGILRVIMGVWLVLFSGTATVMFGALLSRVANPFALMSDFHFFYVVAIVWAILAVFLGYWLDWLSWLIKVQRACWPSLQHSYRFQKFRLVLLWESIL